MTVYVLVASLFVLRVRVLFRVPNTYNKLPIMF